MSAVTGKTALARRLAWGAGGWSWCAVDKTRVDS